MTGNSDRDGTSTPDDRRLVVRVTGGAGEALLTKLNEIQSNVSKAFAPSAQIVDSVRASIAQTYTLQPEALLGFDLAAKMKGLQDGAARALSSVKVPTVGLMPAPVPLRRFVPLVPDPSETLRRLEQKIDALLETGVRLLSENAKTGVKEGFLELRDFIMMIAQGISDERWRKESEN